MIAVTDTGPGMSEDVIEKAYDPFFTTKASRRRYGFGLSQVHGFVKQSKGHVKIYSEVGKGTTVKYICHAIYPKFLRRNAVFVSARTRMFCPRIMWC